MAGEAGANDGTGAVVIVENFHHDYPCDLARFLREQWSKSEASSVTDACLMAASEYLVSTCYQASLLQDEARPVTLRVIVAEPESFAEEQGPPAGLHRLVFSEPLAFTAHELRRLSPAARFHQSLIGVSVTGASDAHIWGIIHSGPRWLRSVHGGRESAPELPPELVLSVSGPGQIEVARGSQQLGQLSDGGVFGPSMNVFEANWLQDFFAPIRSERWDLHLAARERTTKPWTALDPELTRIIDQNMMKRLIAAVRAFHHGGTLVFVPPERASELCGKNQVMDLKYKFAEGEPRARFRTLIVSMMNALAAAGGRKGEERSVSWEQYEETRDGKVIALDEAIFEMSHLIAGLSTVDGAVVMTKRFEVLGFGGEIRSDLSEVRMVAKALDIEGRRTKLESVHGVGTRHRSAYALCSQLREALAIVISQDGGVRFVTARDAQVTYWDHHARFTFSSRF